MTHDPTFWLLARASGLTAYVLLTASVLAGLVLKARPFGRALKPATVTDIHRFLAMLGLGMLVMHGVTLMLDQTVHMPLAGLFVPGASPYRPLAVAAGVVGAELMLLIYVSFSLRKRIGTRNWRRLHYATYLVFGFATIHGFAVGHRLDPAVGARPLPRGDRGRRLRHRMESAQSHSLVPVRPATERST